MKSKPHIAVIGAGAFGGWTALHLLERRVKVTLLDAWGPGNSRASSGGETRILRATYGPDQPYTELAGRALKLWLKYERRWKRRFLHRVGVLWMASSNDDAFEHGSLKPLRQAGIEFQELSARELKKRWPQVCFDGVDWGIYEPECGYLEARTSCQAVVEAFVAAGGKYRQLAVMAEGLEHAIPRGLSLSDGSRLKADDYVFACGPWLGKLFPETIGDLVQATKQDIFFFGTPAGDPVEAAAVGHALGQRRREPLPIGSVKTNIGHLEPASGMAGLLKATLAIDRDQWRELQRLDEVALGLDEA